MIKLINRIKYWIYVRRFHVDGIRLESNEKGEVEVLVEVNGKCHLIRRIDHLGLGVSEGITDYGIAKIAERAR
jgi:hypothetical protein